MCDEDHDDTIIMLRDQLGDAQAESEDLRADVERLTDELRKAAITISNLREAIRSALQGLSSLLTSLETHDGGYPTHDEIRSENSLRGLHGQ